MALPKFSLAAQKIWVAQNLGGLQPPSPPRPVRLWFRVRKERSTITQILIEDVKLIPLAFLQKNFFNEAKPRLLEILQESNRRTFMISFNVQMSIVLPRWVPTCGYFLISDSKSIFNVRRFNRRRFWGKLYSLKIIPNLRSKTGLW